MKQFSDPTSFLSKDTFHNQKGKQEFIICLRLSDKSLSEESENQLQRTQSLEIIAFVSISDFSNVKPVFSPCNFVDGWQPKPEPEVPPMQFYPEGLL